MSGYTGRIRRTRVDSRSIRIKKFADTKISGYVWTGRKRNYKGFDRKYLGNTKNQKIFSGNRSLALIYKQTRLRNNWS